MLYAEEVRMLQFAAATATASGFSMPLEVRTQRAIRRLKSDPATMRSSTSRRFFAPRRLPARAARAVSPRRGEQLLRLDPSLGSEVLLAATRRRPRRGHARRPVRQPAVQDALTTRPRESGTSSYELPREIGTSL
jgi:hypothetical protein